MSLWFVTPAFERYALSAVCFDQRVRVIDALAEQGIEGRCVVVADDGNLDLARDRGFDVVVQDNEWLGRRFNDGIEYAAKHGAEWIVPIGSDSWIDPVYLAPLLSRGFIRTSGLYCAVTDDRLATLDVRGGRGAGPYVFHRDNLARSGYRPAKDELKRFVDSSTVAGVEPANWRWRNVHPYQYIGFRGTPHMTPYRKLVEAWGTGEFADPWSILARHYPADLVDRARVALS